MKRMTRMLSMLLAMLTVVGCFAVTATVTVSAAGAAPNTWWSDYAADDFAGGDGLTPETAFEIATAEQMAYFASYLEGGALNGKTSKTYFKLTADIDMSAHQWNPIGHSRANVTDLTNTLVNGVFDGGNHTIFGIQLSASATESGLDYTYRFGCALFTNLVSSTIQDLKLEAKILDPVLTGHTAFNVSGTKDLSYGAAGVAVLASQTSGSLCTVSNVEATVDLEVRKTGHEYLYAGMVGFLSVNTVFTDCTVNGSMNIDQTDCTQSAAVTTTKAAAMVGGVICYAMGQAQVNNAVNNADITVSTAKGLSYIGGVLAYTNGGAKTTFGTVAMTNNGNISANIASGGASYVGGVYAGAPVVKSLGSSGLGTMHNTGDVNVSEKNACILYIGGVLGWVNNNAANSIEGATNSGNITANIWGANPDYVAGIVGSCTGANGAVIKECTNSGTISFLPTTANHTKFVYCGGIAGYLKDIQVMDCANSGDIVTTNWKGTSHCYAGGIAGLVEGTASTKVWQNITNSGDINLTTASGSYNFDYFAGGVVGQFNSTMGAVNITNTGNVSAGGKRAHFLAGVFGYVNVYQNSVGFDGLFNSGSITSVSASGNVTSAGIIGRIGLAAAAQSGAALNIKNSVNVGHVATPTSGTNLSGGAFGYLQRTTRTISGKTGTYDAPCTVNFENCVGYGSGAVYSLVGSARVHATFTNCFGNTEFLISYNNQNATGGVKNSEDESLAYIYIDGSPVTAGSGKLNPVSSAHINIETLEKARLRLDALGTDESGIRFDSYITKQAYDEINALTGVTLELGTIIAPTQNLNAATIASQYDKMAAFDALEGDYYAKIVFDHTTKPFVGSEQFANADPSYRYFSGALNHILEANYNLSFSAIAYATVTVGDFTFTFYADYDPENLERRRSVAQIAKMAFEDRSAEQGVYDEIHYKFEANEENACYLGDWSPYSNAQLSLLKTWCNYQNIGSVSEGLTINGVSISEYKIVYAQSSIYKNYSSRTGKTLFGDLGNAKIAISEQVNGSPALSGEYMEYGDTLMGARYDYDCQTAIRLRDLIYAEYGVMLEVVPDYSIGADATVTDDDVITPETNYEILIGATNRTKSQSVTIASLGADEFVFNIDDTKVVIAGGSFGATWHAIDKLEAIFTDAGFTAPNYNLKTAGDLSDSHKLQKIACIGDSITFGSQGLPNGLNATGGLDGAAMKFGTAAVDIYFRDYLSYPANLQRGIWKDAVVYNYGRGNSTLGNYGDANYYASTAEWATCKADVDSDDVAFDLVFFMHGTNDASKAGGAATWSSDQKDHFKEELVRMMDYIRNDSANVQFVFNNVPHLFDGTNTVTNAISSDRKEHNEAALRIIQKEVVADLDAAGYTVYYYDMNSYTKDHLVDGTCTHEGYCETGESLAAAFDSRGEQAAHGNYYNIHTTYITNEGTHPNFRGYNKMSEGVLEVVNDLLFNGAKSDYLTDVGA